VAHNVYYSALIYIVYSDCTAVSNSYRPLADEVFFFQAERSPFMQYAFVHSDL